MRRPSEWILSCCLRFGEVIQGGDRSRACSKGGGLVSGDSYNMMELGTGKYAAAISDGMGNGARAHFESNETIKLLEKILQSGIDEKWRLKRLTAFFH